MRKSIFLFIVILITQNMNAQDISGQWTGLLKIQNLELRLVFNISKSNDSYKVTMDSPDQGAKDIPVDKVAVDNEQVRFEITPAQIVYDGKIVNSGIIEGTFQQSGQSFHMELTKAQVKSVPSVNSDSQLPVPPYPYRTEEVKFVNKKAKIELAGTLTIPQQAGIYPAVILISGSGPQNRDEELLGHKPFLVLADHLTKNGFAVLRYDDRGTAASGGDFATSTSFDFAADAQAAVEYLATRKEINSKKIGLMGHSEGGIIAPMVAGKSKKVAFIVLLAGTGIRGDQLLLMQQEAIGKVSGMSEAALAEAKKLNQSIFEMVISTDNDDELKKNISKLISDEVSQLSPEELPPGVSPEQIIQQTVDQLTSPWMYQFIRYDPSLNLNKVKCPVLAINGSKDLQVPAKVNLAAIEKELLKGGNKKVTVKELPGLNHLFQECTTGSPEEYALIKQTFSPVALAEITNWLKKIN